MGVALATLAGARCPSTPAGAHSSKPRIVQAPLATCVIAKQRFGGPTRRRNGASVRGGGGEGARRTISSTTSALPKCRRVTIWIRHLAQQIRMLVLGVSGTHVYHHGIVLGLCRGLGTWLIFDGVRWLLVSNDDLGEG